MKHQSTITRVFVILLLSSSTLPLLGCSTSVLFAVRNLSGETATVIVTTDLAERDLSWCILEPGKYFTGPAVASISSLDDDWWKVPQSDFDIQYNPDECSVSMVVPADHAAVIWVLSNYPYAEELADWFPTSVVVHGIDNQLELTGPNIYRDFKPFSETLYVLDY